MDGGVALRDFIGVVAKIRDRAIPVVGAGLSVDAGGASSGDLLRALRDAEAGEGNGPSPLPGEGFFDIVDAYEARRGEEWVRNVVAAEVGRRWSAPSATRRTSGRGAGRRGRTRARAARPAGPSGRHRVHAPGVGLTAQTSAGSGSAAGSSVGC